MTLPTSAIDLLFAPSRPTPRTNPQPNHPHHSAPNARTSGADALDSEDDEPVQWFFDIVKNQPSQPKKTQLLAAEHKSALLQLREGVDAVAAKLGESAYANLLTNYHSVVAGGDVDAEVLTWKIKARTQRLKAEVEKTRKEVEKAGSNAERIWVQAEKLDEEANKRIEEIAQVVEQNERLGAGAEKVGVQSGRRSAENMVGGGRDVLELMWEIQRVESERVKMQAEASRSMGEMQWLKAETERLMVEVKWPWAGTGCQEVARD